MNTITKFRITKWDDHETGDTFNGIEAYIWPHWYRIKDSFSWLGFYYKKDASDYIKKLKSIKPFTAIATMSGKVRVLNINN